MNYLKKNLISAIEADIYNSNSYDVGVILGETLKRLADANVEGCETEPFIEGIRKGFQRAAIKSITGDSE